MPEKNIPTKNIPAKNIPAKKTATKQVTPKTTQFSEVHRIDPELSQFLQTFLTSSVISEKLHLLEKPSTKNQMAAIKKKVDSYEKSATPHELALFEFVTNYGLSEMYNKSLMALLLNFTLNGSGGSTQEIAQHVEMLLRPLTLPEHRERAAYVFKEWLIDHAQESVKQLTKPARKKRS